MENSWIESVNACSIQVYSFCEQLREMPESDRKKIDEIFAHGWAVARLVSQVYPLSPVPDHVILGAFLHDVVEDEIASLDQVRTAFRLAVVELVDVLTEEPGPRAQRQPKAYARIRAYGTDALTVKLCDRVVNLRRCWRNQDRRLFMYHKEHARFSSLLFPQGPPDFLQPLWQEYLNLVGEGEK